MQPLKSPSPSKSPRLAPAAPQRETAKVAPKKVTPGKTAASTWAPQAKGPTAQRDVAEFKKYLLDQGNTNACGTTSASMLVNFWNKTPGKTQHAEIDQSIRRADMFTSPQNLQGWYEKHGFRASATNNATVDQLASFVDKGVPVQVLYDPSGEKPSGDKDSFLHYVDVVGLARDAKGTVTGVKLADPAGGSLTTVPLATFKARWDNLKFEGVGSGLNNVMIVAMPKQGVTVKGADGRVRNTNDVKLPASGGFGTRGFLVDKVADVTNTVSRWLGID